VLSPSQLLGARILVVDDHEANVLLLLRMLEGAGYTSVSSTMDPCRVRELHRENRYDLILLDLQMPGMDGFEVMESLRDLETDGYLPVLAITAQPAHELRALQAGAKDFVSKPFALAEVLMRVHNLLEVRLLHEAARNHAKALETLALHDPLTGLANRRLLAERMGIALAHARMNHSAMAVLCLDLDGFKEINDTFGHANGDALLKSVATRLVAVVRADDTVARLGGDEFAIALWRVGSVEDATRVASQVLEAVAQPHACEATVMNITASVGISTYPANGEDAKTLMESADMASYDAKRAGKNTLRIARSLGTPAIAHVEHERRAVPSS
jgi:diguanylate cyclase (GGDEF)-like protein